MKQSKKLIDSLPKGAIDLKGRSEKVAFPISVHELGFILILREFIWGEMTIQKMDGEVRRVSTSKSRLIDGKLLVEKLAEGKNGSFDVDIKTFIDQLKLAEVNNGRV